MDGVGKMLNVKDTVAVTSGINVYLDDIYSRLKLTKAFAVFMYVPSYCRQKIVSLCGIHRRGRSAVHRADVGQLLSCLDLYEQDVCV